jgi:hypothetical protein
LFADYSIPRPKFAFFECSLMRSFAIANISIKTYKKLKPKVGIVRILKLLRVVCVLAFSLQSASAGILYENKFSISWAPIESQGALEKVPSQTPYKAVSNDFQKHLKPNETFFIYTATSSDFHEGKAFPPNESYFREDGALCSAKSKKPAALLFQSENHLDTFVVFLMDIWGSNLLFADYFTPRPKFAFFESGAKFSSSLIYSDRSLALGHLERLPEGKDLSGKLSIKRNGEIATKSLFRTGGETGILFKIELEKEGDYTFEISLEDETVIWELPYSRVGRDSVEKQTKRPTFSLAIPHAPSAL